jgi:hypothetical protein
MGSEVKAVHFGEGRLYRVLVVAGNHQLHPTPTPGGMLHHILQTAAPPTDPLSATSQDVSVHALNPKPWQERGQVPTDAWNFINPRPGAGMCRVYLDPHSLFPSGVPETPNVTACFPARW